MAYDQKLASRVRERLRDVPQFEEREKMGGHSFMVSGTVRLRVQDDDLVVRCEPGRTEELLGRRGVQRFTMKGKTQMKGWVLVSPEVLRTKKDLDFWIDVAIEFGANRR
jgi:hypothetical protein